MRVVVLIAMASLLANAQCVADCAYHSCSNPSTPRCHHQAPSSNQDDRQRPCSHQMIAPSQSGVSDQITTGTGPIVFEDCANIYAILNGTAPDSPRELESSPLPSDFRADTAVLRI